mmetsp:Transcript_8324/g.22253  ORF Transcript_8324/g.22253 Transcript_8324/m.22253 type:complete len:100 (+) Transcript_8324:210-509(+)
MTEPLGQERKDRVRGVPAFRGTAHVTRSAGGVRHARAPHASTTAAADAATTKPFTRSDTAQLSTVTGPSVAVVRVEEVAVVVWGVVLLVAVEVLLAVVV